MQQYATIYTKCAKIQQYTATCSNIEPQQDTAIYTTREHSNTQQYATSFRHLQQHTPIFTNVQQYAAMYRNQRKSAATCSNTQQFTAIHRNLPHCAAMCRNLQQPAAKCSDAIHSQIATQQHTAKYCKRLQDSTGIYRKTAVHRNLQQRTTMNSKLQQY